MVAWVFGAITTIATPQGITVTGATAAELAAADQISIVGPTTAKPNAEVVCRIQGTPPIDLTLPLAEQLDWLMGADRMHVYLAAPGQPMTPVDVRAEIVFGHDGATMQPMLRVDVAAAGEYRLVVDWNFGQNQLVEHIITVEGGVEPAPDPFPEPEPTPDPPPPGERFVLIVSESHDRTSQESATLTGLRRWLTARGQDYRIADPKPKTGPPPAWMKPYLEEIKDQGIKGSALMVSVSPTSSHDGAYLVAESLPATSTEAIAIVKEALDR